MRKIPYKTWLWAGVFLLYPWVAHAAGLGKFTVLSSLGQPLSAEIDLVSVQKDELATLTARLASPEAFQQANMQYSPALIGVRLSIERRADGKPYIKMTSSRAINEPFLGVLIELSWAQGRLLREYTALIDPPGYTPTAPAPLRPPVVAATPDAPSAAPETKAIAPTPQPEAVAAAPAPKAPAAKAVPSPAPAKAAASEYAVKRGDTLAKIAASVKPEGVTLDQMLVTLYRNNTDAFAGNMNRLKTGKILRVPEKESIVETVSAAATKEVRVQASNWNAYRAKLADAAGTTPAQESTKSAASGKITAAEDKAVGKEAPKEVLKLTKGEAAAPGKAGSGKPASVNERLRMMEEEATAREKSLAEANERVAQLEKNIKAMQRLLELKGTVPGAKPVVTPPPAKAEAKGEATKAPPPAPAKAEPPKAEAAKMAPPKDAGKAPVEPPKADQKADQKAVPPVVEPPKGEAIKGDAPKADLAKGEASKGDTPKADTPKAEPAPKPKPKPAPPPVVAEPGLVDQIISAATDPIYLAGGLGGLAVLGGGAFWFARRRRAQDGDGGGKAAKTAPTIAKPDAAPAAAMTASPVMGPAVAGSDDVDPLAEADLYLNFGRDAQAEEVLKEALEKNPQHEEAHLKLLQIYAARKDKGEFEKIASKLHTQTAGVGDNWLKAAGMGYAFDPENALYEAGKSAPAAAAPAVGGGIPGTDLDFDLELAPGAGGPTKTDVELDSGEKTMMMRPGELAAGASGLPPDPEMHDITQDSVSAQAFTEAASPDFTLNVPAGAAPATMTDITVGPGGENDMTKTNVTGDSAVPMASVIDFNFDATAAADAPAKSAEPADFKHDSTVVISPENQDNAAGLTMDFDIAGAAPAAPVGNSSVVPLDLDFKLDLSGDVTMAPGSAPTIPPLDIPDIKLDDISLNLDDAPKADAAAGAGAKDDHWYDVQTKFDLAKAYQEMGDKDGAREILQEVIKEGDAAQQTEAKQLLNSLG